MKPSRRAILTGTDLIAYADALFDIPGVTSTPPLGPPLLLSLRRRPEGRLLRLQPEALRLAA